MGKIFCESTIKSLDLMAMNGLIMALLENPQEESPIDLFETLPDSMLSEILKRLPVKELLRCRCVIKSWYNLIKTPGFIKLHLNHQRETVVVDTDEAARKLLVFNSPVHDKLLYIRTDDEHCKEFYKLELPPVISKVYANWYAVSNSLVCVSTIFGARCLNHGWDIYLWNPLIQRCKTLPFLDLSHIVIHHWAALAFGYVPSINDFQVVLIVSDNFGKIPTFYICVYSLNTNSWKTKTILDDLSVRFLKVYESVSVNGISCWIMINQDNHVETLVCYDSVNDILRKVALPHHTDDYSLHQLLPFDQSVALFHKKLKLNAFEMWILKQDSMKNDFFWEKKVSVTLGKHLYNIVIGTRNNRELIFKSKFHQRGLITYNPETNKVNNFVHSWKHWSTLGIDGLFSTAVPFLVDPFVDGLVLLDTD